MLEEIDRLGRQLRNLTLANAHANERVITEQPSSRDPFYAIKSDDYFGPFLRHNVDHHGSDTPDDKLMDEAVSSMTEEFRTSYALITKTDKSNPAIALEIGKGKSPFRTSSYTLQKCPKIHSGLRGPW